MSEDKCCGNCKHFKNEDVDGKGWCDEQSWVTGCSKVCKLHEFGANGWTEITPDNVNELNKIEKRVVVANKHHGSVFYRTIHDVNGLESMAKQGGYYYYVLPELKVECNQ